MSRQSLAMSVTALSLAGIATGCQPWSNANFATSTLTARETSYPNKISEERLTSLTNKWRVLLERDLNRVPSPEQALKFLQEELSASEISQVLSALKIACPEKTFVSQLIKSYNRLNPDAMIQPLSCPACYIAAGITISKPETLVPQLFATASEGAAFKIVITKGETILLEAKFEPEGQAPFSSYSGPCISKQYHLAAGTLGKEDQILISFEFENGTCFSYSSKIQMVEGELSAVPLDENGRLFSLSMLNLAFSLVPENYAHTPEIQSKTLQDFVVNKKIQFFDWPSDADFIKCDLYKNGALNPASAAVSIVICCYPGCGPCAEVEDLALKIQARHLGNVKVATFNFADLSIPLQRELIQNSVRKTKVDAYLCSGDVSAFPDVLVVDSSGGLTHIRRGDGDVEQQIENAIGAALDLSKSSIVLPRSVR